MQIYNMHLANGLTDINSIKIYLNFIIIIIIIICVLVYKATFLRLSSHVFPFPSIPGPSPSAYTAITFTEYGVSGMS